MEKSKGVNGMMSVVLNDVAYTTNELQWVLSSYRGAFLLFYHKLHKSIFLFYYALDNPLRMLLSYFSTFALMLMDVFCAIVLNMRHGNQGNIYRQSFVFSFYTWNIVSYICYRKTNIKVSQA
jgi:hypothetical protein